MTPTASGGFTPQEVQTYVVQSTYTVMSLSIFGSAMGSMIGAMGSDVTLKKKMPVTGPGVAALKAEFGETITDAAIAKVGSDDITKIAREVELSIITDMTAKYGIEATRAGVAAANPGDLKTARVIAQTLSGLPVTTSPEIKAKIVASKKGKKPGQAVKDTKTGIVYGVKYKAGVAVAAEYGISLLKANGDPDTWVWFTVIQKDPSRFVFADDGSPVAVQRPSGKWTARVRQ